MNRATKYVLGIPAVAAVLTFASAALAHAGNSL